MQLKIFITAGLMMVSVIIIAQKKLPVLKSTIGARFDIAQAPAPLFRDPVFDGAADPTVIWNESTKEWLIFYTSRRAILELKNVAYCYGTAIGMAASKDYGKTWQYKGTARLPQPDTGLNSFWAPQVFQNPDDYSYHMLVTYIKGVYEDWGGEAKVFHYTSKDLKNWKWLNPTGLSGYIDASVFRMPDHTWKLWYSKQGVTYSANSKDLLHWAARDTPVVQSRRHEAPIVFYFDNAYWLVTDPNSDGYVGLDVFRSVDATHWEFNNTILNTPGVRPDDIDQGRHADIKVVNGKMYIFYFTHPGRVFINEKEEDPDKNRWRYRRSSLQVAELELKNGKMTCNRNKYALMQPVVELKIPQ